MAAGNQGYCSTPECDEEAVALGYCKRCYSYFYQWNKKTSKQKLKRINQLNMYSIRFEMMGEPIRIKTRVTAKDKIKIMPGEAKTGFKNKKLRVVNG